LASEFEGQKRESVINITEGIAREIVRNCGLNLLPDGNHFHAEILSCPSRAKMVSYLQSLTLGNDDELRVSLITSLRSNKIGVRDKVIIIQDFKSKTFKGRSYEVKRVSEDGLEVIINDGINDFPISKREVITQSENLMIGSVRDLLDARNVYRKQNKAGIEALINERRRFSLNGVLSAFLGNRIWYRGLTEVQQLFLTEYEKGKEKVPQALFISELKADLRNRIKPTDLENGDNVYCVEVNKSLKELLPIGEVTIVRDITGKIKFFTHADKEILYDPEVHEFFILEEIERINKEVKKLKKWAVKELLLSLKLKINGT
jgi:hypothetical protein